MYTYIINKNIITICNENQSLNRFEYANTRLKFKISSFFKKTEFTKI